MKGKFDRLLHSLNKQTISVRFNFIVRSPPSTRKTLTNSPSVGSTSSNGGHSLTSPIAESSGSLSPPTAHTRNRSRSPTPQIAICNSKIGSEHVQVMTAKFNKNYIFK